MSILRVTSLRGRTSGTSPTLPDGAVVTGVTTTGTLAVSGVATAASSVVAGIVTTNVSGIDVGAGIATATTFDGALTGNVTGNINASSASGISTVGILTAYSSIHINVGSGSTEVATELSNKTSPGKAIALSMVFG